MFNRRTLLASLASMPAASPLFATPRQPLWQDDFRQGLRQWRLEATGDAHVTAREGILDIDAPKGLTLWFLPRLSGPVAIRYDVRAVSAGGPHDEVSDVNAFWMAGDPVAPDQSALATRRSGAFEAYDSLTTYYVGIGGNRNSTTRMRRYVGQAGQRPLLPQHDRTDEAAMLQPNMWFTMGLIADGNHIAVERDGATLFMLDDPAPYRNGHFGLRTTQSHLQVRNLVITRH